MEDILKACRPQTKLCIAANITCEGEYIKTRTVKEWKGKLPDLTKVPCIFLIYTGRCFSAGYDERTSGPLSTVAKPFFSPISLYSLNWSGWIYSATG